MRHFVHEAFFSQILYVLHSLVMFSEKVLSERVH